MAETMAPRDLRLIGDDLACQRAGRIVFREVHFAIAAGQCLMLRGRNGVGKTSLLRLIAGLVPMLSGSVALEGGADDTPVGEQSHFIAHLAAIKPVLTVEENICFWKRYRGGEGDVAAALDQLGIGHLADLPARYLSAGQQRRLALARLIIIERPLWLLDEPLTALDVDGIALLTSLMQTHLNAGGIIVAATHADLDIEADTLDLVAA